MATEMVGSIPSRIDAAADPSVSGNELLAPFAQTIAERGHTYPDPIVPPDAVGDIQLAIGQAWSAAISGQLTPADAAAQAIAIIAPLLGQ